MFAGDFLTNKMTVWYQVNHLTHHCKLLIKAKLVSTAINDFIWAGPFLNKNYVIYTHHYNAIHVFFFRSRSSVGNPERVDTDVVCVMHHTESINWDIMPVMQWHGSVSDTPEKTISSSLLWHSVWYKIISKQHAKWKHICLHAMKYIVCTKQVSNLLVIFWVVASPRHCWHDIDGLVQNCRIS